MHRRTLRSRARHIAWGLAAALVASGACTPSFDDPWLVQDLRILAVRAEPPELVFRAIPTSIPTVRIDALAVDPRTAADERYSWELWACTPGATSCDDADLAVKVQEATTTLAEISYDGFAPSLELFSESLVADDYKGFGGLPMIVELRIDDAIDPTLTVAARKRLVYTFPLPYSPVPDDKQPNANPALERVQADEESIEGQLAATPEQEVTLLPEPADGAAEAYVVVTSKALQNPTQPLTGTGVEHLDEHLVYRFYTTAGRLSHERTGGTPLPFIENKKAFDVTSKWTAPEEPGEVTLWVTVDDERGGAGWTELRAIVAR